VLHGGSLPPARTALAAALLLAAACTPTLDLAPGAQLSCTTDAECRPFGLVCSQFHQRCLDPQDLLVTVTSSPSLLLPAGQTEVKSGDRLGIRGQGSAGAAVESARLIEADSGETLLALEPEAVTIDSAGSMGGELRLPPLAHGARVQLEVVLALRLVPSDPAKSRSQVVTIDNQPPPKPVQSGLKLVEDWPPSTAPDAVSDERNTFTLSAENAFVDASAARIYADSLRALPLASVPVSLGGFAPVVLPHVTAEAYFVASADGAGNESGQVAVVRVPQLTSIVVAPQAAGDASSLTVDFESSTPRGGGRRNGDPPIRAGPGGHPAHRLVGADRRRSHQRREARGRNGLVLGLERDRRARRRSDDLHHPSRCCGTDPRQKPRAPSRDASSTYTAGSIDSPRWSPASAPRQAPQRADSTDTSPSLAPSYSRTTACGSHSGADSPVRGSAAAP
jgi:hypothetical protein